MKAEEFINNKLGDKNYTHSPYQIHRDELCEWLNEFNNINKNITFTGVRIDNGEHVTGWFTKKKIGNLIVPVIEVYKEHDSGDYIQTYEVNIETVNLTK